MAPEPFPERLGRLDRALPRKRVHGVLHRVGRENLRVVAGGVRRAELALELHLDRQVVQLVPVPSPDPL